MKTTNAINSALSFLALSALVTLVAACGNNGSQIQSNANNPGAGALGSNVDMKNCQIGQTYNATTGCLNRGSSYIGTTAAGATGAGTLITGQIKFGSNAMTRHFGALTITNTAQMELLLQSAGLCNGSYYGATSTNVSTSRCSQWISRGAFAAVTSYQGSADNMNITIGAGSTTMSYDLATTLSAIDGSTLGVYGAYGAVGSIYGSSNYVSFSQQAHNYAYNNNNGLQLVGITPSHESINFMVIVENGNLGLDHVDAKLVYQGVQVATLTLTRF